MKKINIDGMDKKDGAQIVEYVLSRLENAEAVRVYGNEGYAEFIGSVSDEKITDALSSHGFTVTSIE